MNNNKAFSLIELSMVLIIIGLLVAGIIGGQSLIESARIRSLVNDFRYYEQSLYSFKLIKDRLPGDLNGSGKIGQGSGQLYDGNSFPAPYNKNDGFYGIPTADTAPFVDLYLAKVIDFEPKNNNYFDGGLHPLNGGVPNPKIGFGRILFAYREPQRYENNTYGSDHALYGITGNNTIEWYIMERRQWGLYRMKEMPVEFYKELDLKIDDGKYNSGVVRGGCMSSRRYLSYEEATKCSSLFYILK